MFCGKLLFKNFLVLYLEYAIIKFLNVIGQCKGSKSLAYPLG